MSEGQRSNWLASRLFGVGLAIAAAAAYFEYRPSDAAMPWRSYAAGMEEARSTGKPVYVDVSATWCGPCRQMERTTFVDDTVRALLTTKYVPVRIDIDTKEFADSLRASWNIRAVPTSLILSARGGTLGRKMGYVDAHELSAWLDDPAILAFAGWLDYSAARVRALEVRKPLLVIMTRGLENLDEIREFFMEPKFRAFLQDRFIATRLTGEGAEEQQQIAGLRSTIRFSESPAGGITLIALATDGNELGRVVLDGSELEDQARVMELLDRYLQHPRLQSATRRSRGR